ncbi:MBL fold metallo-hydrolase [Gordonia rubripertincta]|uniref:MBL fold metallo-hydrolase n=1 Tax=Gordonia rubripertincta TaxID=36822 RepID=UPI00117F4975|nr:MBL fold metallo-hydrolase [Gordonia rubripertincta]TSD92844.1 MBL fold metallo-hydrolase [Gordonia rubripertincta]
MSTTTHQQNAVRIERVVTSGDFRLDGGCWHVDNNVWIVGNDDEVVVIDAAHTAEPIIEAVRGRNVAAVICTHGHNDHVTVAPQLGHKLHAPVLLHPADDMLWSDSHGEERYVTLHDDQDITAGGVTLTVLHTPGHSPGSVCLYAEQLDAVFSGDTLFSGGPGATGRSDSDFPTIIESIRTRLLTLPAATVVHTGHGEDTQIGEEAPYLEEWITRGQ